MTARLRFGGRGQGADGANLVWSVAEGSRGCRWREVRNVGQGVATSLLLETDREGRFAHLELSTASGLLTLHPGGDGSLHGHAIVSDGVEHVAGLRWEPDALAMIDGSTICRAAAARHIARSLAVGSSMANLAVVVPPTLWLEVKPIRIERLDVASWRFGAEDPIILDDSGLPLLRGGETWPLEAVDDRGERHR